MLMYVPGSWLSWWQSAAACAEIPIILAASLPYLESRLSKVGSERRTRLKERRRQDVKNQPKQLAAMTAGCQSPGCRRRWSRSRVNQLKVRTKL